MSTELPRVWAAWMPITGALGITVASSDEESLVLAMPLDPNRNYQGTVFGGSMAALATLAGWSALWLLMQRDNVEATLLVQDSAIRYPRPARSDVLARAALPSAKDWQEAVETFRRHGKARIGVEVTGRDDQGQVVAEFQGRYVLTS